MIPWSMLRQGCEPCLFLKEALPLREFFRDIGRCVTSSSSSDLLIQQDLAGICRTRAVIWLRCRLTDLSDLSFLIHHRTLPMCRVDVDDAIASRKREYSFPHSIWGLCRSNQGVPKTISCLAIGTTSRTTVSWCCWKTSCSGIVSLSTSGRDEPSTAVNSYPPSFFLRVAIPCCLTNWAAINIPLAPESIMA